MICRPTTTADGRAGWILISQVDHAKLAGQLARHWKFWCDPDLAESRAELLQAIYHHDDGWPDWEQQPKFHPDEPRPLTFLEMPLNDALTIWSQSIEQCAEIGPLAGYVVAGHFVVLLAQSNSARSPAANQWLKENRRKQSGWLQQWCDKAPQQHTPELATEALNWLRFFDAVSLWFCCGPGAQISSVVEPAGRTVEFSLHGDDGVRVAPWPLDITSLQLHISAREFLADGSTTDANLVWNVQPADSDR